MRDYGKLNLTKFSARKDNIITVTDGIDLKSEVIPSINHTISIEVGKLLKKAIYTQMTTEELESVKNIINQILKTRVNNDRK